MFYTLVFGMIIGFVACLYFIVSKKKKNTGNNSGAIIAGQSVYLNLTILDKTNAVTAGVTDKLHSKMGHGFLRDKIATKIGKVAGSRIPDSVIAKMMCGKMVEKMPRKMVEMGLTATAKKVYGKGSFFVIKLTLLQADLQKILTKVAGETKASKFDEMMALLGGQVAKDTLGLTVLPMIASKLQDKLPEKMQEIFEEKQLNAEVVVRTQEEQAAFFFDLMHQEDDEEDDKKQ